MQARLIAMAGATVLALAVKVPAQELQWRPAKTPAVTLGRPVPASSAALAPPPASAEISKGSGVTLSAPRPVVRAQGADPFPAPPPPPPPPNLATPVNPFPAGPYPGEEAYNCGVANTKPGAEGFFGRCWDKIKECCSGARDHLGSAFQAGPGGTMFQSDHKFDGFISPVTNPFYFEDPRALTEVRPIFMWQNTPSSVPLFAGGDNFFFGLRGSVAFTEWLSLTVDQLGWFWTEIQQPSPGFASHSGFGEVHFGPKVTFIRKDTSNTLLAAGAIFELPVGSNSVFQSTGNLSITPYLSFGQNFGRSDYGSFNFLNTTGYSFAVDSDRADFLYSSFHLDYDVLNLKKIYPLVELNFYHYTANGGVNSLNFEGRDMFHLGATGVRGNSELTIAAGARYKFSEAIQLGVAAEFGLINRSRSLDDFRLTVDLIFRY